MCLGVVLGAHGVRGLLRIRSYTEDPRAIVAYGPLEDESGRPSLKLAIESVRERFVIAAAHGIASRSAAEALKGTRLFVARTALPEPGAGEFYHDDLIGLRVALEDGRSLGRVRAIANYGAGDLIEIEPEGGGATLLIPFTKSRFPEVDLAQGRLVVVPEAGDID